MRLRIYFASSVCLCVAFVSGCTKAGSVEVVSGRGITVGVGGGGGAGSGYGTTSGGTGTGDPGSPPGTSGGTGTGTSGGLGTGPGGSGMGGGSGGSGGSGGATGGVVLPGGAPKLASADPGVKALQGLVNAGRSQAIAGARVYVLQADTTGKGNPSLSLLTSAVGDTHDSIGYYALTGEYGGFSIAGYYNCTSGRQVYLYVRGTDARGSPSAVGLMAALGACPAAGNFTSAEPFVIVNEVTTVAAAYGMASGAADPSHISSFALPGSVDAAKLARVSTGVANAGVASAPGTKVPQTTINTLANILFACIDSSGPASAGCTTLFENARGADGLHALPADTAAAAINIARRPRANIATLYSLQLKAPFQPSLGSAPADFTIVSPNAALVSALTHSD